MTGKGIIGATLLSLGVWAFIFSLVLGSWGLLGLGMVFATLGMRALLALPLGDDDD